MVTVWWSAASLIHYSFLNPSEIITSEKFAQQINQMHRKLQCLQLALVNRKSLSLHHDNTRPHVTQPMLQKLNKLGYKVLSHPPFSLTSHQPTTTSSSILTTFCRENTSTVSRRQKMLSKSLSSMDFTLQDETNLFLIGKNVLIEMVPILN